MVGLLRLPVAVESNRGGCSSLELSKLARKSACWTSYSADSIKERLVNIKSGCLFWTH